MDNSITTTYALQQQQIRKVFSQDGKVLLYSFLQPNIYQQLRAKIQLLTPPPSQNPLTHSYSSCLLPTELQQKLNSAELQQFLSIILGKINTLLSWKLFSFSWKDYTLLHDSVIEPSGIDIILDLTENWNQKAGGSIIFVDGSGDYTSIPVQGNLLVVVQRKQGMQRFVQYINHHGKNKSRQFLLAQIFSPSIKVDFQYR